MYEWSPVAMMAASPSLPPSPSDETNDATRAQPGRVSLLAVAAPFEYLLDWELFVSNEF